MYPAARRENLHTERIADELVVYDLSNHHSHCLNRTASCVWELADGTRSIDALARELSVRCDVPVDSNLVEFCLGELTQRNLLAPADAPRARATVSRRALIARPIGGAPARDSLDCGANTSLRAVSRANRANGPHRQSWPHWPHRSNRRSRNYRAHWTLWTHFYRHRHHRAVVPERLDRPDRTGWPHRPHRPRRAHWA